MESIRVLMDKYGKISKSQDQIGYVGENRAKEIIFEIDESIEVGLATIEINQNNEKYIVALEPRVEEEKTVYTLPIYNSLLTYPTLFMNLRINGNEENQIIKSEVFKFSVSSSVEAIDVLIPEEYETIIDELQDEIDLLNQTKANKSEVYTQEEVNQLISAITALNIDVVEELPTEDISTTTIYLVPKATSQTDNVYDEYVYVNETWELIGDTEIDISSKQNRPTVTTSSLTTYTISSLEENTVYKLGNLTNLVISQVSTFDIESIIYFTSNSTNVTIPSSLVNLGDVPELTTSGGANIGTCESNKSYIIAILNGIAVWKAY